MNITRRCRTAKRDFVFAKARTPALYQLVAPIAEPIRRARSKLRTTVTDGNFCRRAMTGIPAVDEIIQLAKRCRFTPSDPSAATRSVGRILADMECPMKRLFALLPCRFSLGQYIVAVAWAVAAATGVADEWGGIARDDGAYIYASDEQGAIRPTAWQLTWPCPRTRFRATTSTAVATNVATNAAAIRAAGAPTICYATTGPDRN